MLNLHARPFNKASLITIKLMAPLAAAAQFAIKTAKNPNINISITRHSAGFAALAILIIALMGCSLMKPSLPPQGALRATLDKVIKKDSPEATYSITSTDVHSSQKLIIVKLSFENVKVKDKDGKERGLSSGKASASFDYKDGKWILSSFQTSEPEIVLLFPDLLVE